MISISFFNNKGGVGKTTLLCNVAAYLSQEMGYRVCIVDCDPQCNASQYIFHDDKLEQIINNESRNIDFIFKGVIEGTGYANRIPVERSASFNVDVICGSPRLSMAEDFLAEEWAQIHKVRGLSSTLIYEDLLSREGANKRGNSSRLTQSFHSFMFEPIFFSRKCLESAYLDRFFAI
ncbi:ParA family protein [Aeromonas caviae]